MQTPSKLTLTRLNKQQQQLAKDPIQHVMVKRMGLLDFHFLIFRLPQPYTKGFYHFMIKLPYNYPLSAPSVISLTPNGRFIPNKPICTTFTNYHQNTWNCIWNLRTMIQAIISFMNCQDYGVGGIIISSTKSVKIFQQKQMATTMTTAMTTTMAMGKTQGNLNDSVGENVQPLNKPHKIFNPYDYIKIDYNGSHGFIDKQFAFRVRNNFSKRTFEHNMKNQIFMQLFYPDLKAIYKMQQKQPDNEGKAKIFLTSKKKEPQIKKQPDQDPKQND